MAKKRLGIEALFQSSVPLAVPQVPAPDMSGALEIDVHDLAPNPRQPRTYYDELSLDELAESIRTHGIIQPLIVRMVGGEPPYQIVAGERRWRAAGKAGLKRVPVRVVALSDADALTVAMVENLQREDLNPIEEAEGYLDMLANRLSTESVFVQFLGSDDSASGVIRVLRALNNHLAGNTKDSVVLSLEPVVSEVFQQVGRITWKGFVAHRLPLLNLPDDLRRALRTGGLPHTKARVIARVTAEHFDGDETRARKIRRDLINQATTERRSVRELQAEVARIVSAHQRGAAKVKLEPPRLDIDAVRETLTSLGARLSAIDYSGYSENELAAILSAASRLDKIL